LTTFRLVFLFVMLGLVAWSSCAYYNILWMARADYEKAVQSGGYDFWDPYEQSPLSGNSRELVESCIERCGKLILLHPNSRWVDDALLLMGNCFVLTGDHQNALRKYDEILQLYGSADLAPMARYMKAYTLTRDDSPQQAVTLLEGMSKDTERREIRERAVYLLGRIAHERNNCTRAIGFFEAYLEDFPKGAKKAKVRLHLATCLLKLGEAGRVIEVLEPLAEKRDQDGYQAAIKMGEAYRALSENDKAIGIFARLTEQASADSVKARSKMETAKTMVARGEVEEAVTILEEAAEIATARLTELHDQIVYTQGLVYEKNLDDFQSAIASYDKIAQSKSEYGERARKRSDALNQVARFQGALADTVPISPEDEALNRFMLAETYLEELGLEKEAFREFKIVADSFPDTRLAPQAMLRTAVLLEEEGEGSGEEYFRRVIELYPETVHANMARSRLGIPLVDVKIAKPVVWDAGEVIGPPGPVDSLSVAGPEIPGPQMPAEALPDTVGSGAGKPPVGFRPDRTSPIRELPDFPRGRPGHAESSDTSGLQGGGPGQAIAPEDTTGGEERYRP
jgi:TolA-binding protein